MRAIRTYCPKLNKKINNYVISEKDSPLVPYGSYGSKVLGVGTNICKLLNNITGEDIPPAYRDELNIYPYKKTMCAKDDKAKTSLMNKIDGLFFNSISADEPTKAYNILLYTTALEAGNNATAPSTDILNKLDENYKKEPKNVTTSSTTADNTTAGTSGTTTTTSSKKCGSTGISWWKNFTCSVGTVAGITTVGALAMKYLLYREQKKEWEEQLKLDKLKFEEGDCYPYKSDISSTIPLTIGGRTVNYSMYEFCKLSATGALAFLDPCTALSAEGAPTTAIERCYGIYTHNTGGAVTYATPLGNTAAAANTNAAAANNNNGAKDAAAAAASPTTAGTTAGAAAATTPTEKKAKSYESVYPSSYGYPQNPQKSTSAYPSQYEPQTATTASTANKGAAKTSAVVREPSIIGQVAGQVVIRDNVGNKVAH
jgi:hypothetical protein